MVNLAVGMTAIRRDGGRVGPVETFDASDHPYHLDGVWYGVDGLSNIAPSKKDIIAAGYPWATLGAQVGDTVRCVWYGPLQKADDCVFEVFRGFYAHSRSLYVIVKPAAKPADRPRAAHKLDLQDGDVVELVGWQCDCSDSWVGHKYRVKGNDLFNVSPSGDVWCDIKAGIRPKGHRPLFTVLSRAAEQVRGDYSLKDGKWEKHRAAEQKPDEVFTIHKRDKAYVLTFPHGSDTGTVVREAL